MSRLSTILLCLLLTATCLADFLPHPQYQEADKLLQSSKYVKAREIGEEMLRKDPESFEAQAILGRVHLHGEGNPGKADYYLRKALKGIEKKYPTPNRRGGPWMVYADVLWALRLAAMDLEHYQDAIDWVDEYDRAYPPARPHLKGWPLMKLGRIEEARRLMEQARRQVEDKPEAVNTILNTMGAVEYEARNFEESMRNFEEIIQRVERGLGGIDAVFYSNAAEASRDLLDFPAAERYLLKSVRYAGSTSYSTPWLDLSELYTAQGRQPEAIQALKRHAKHLASCEADIKNQNRANSQRVLGMTLLACGYDDEATDLLYKVALHGDRNSGTSTKRSLIRSRNFYFYREALKQKRERLRERRSYSGLAQWFPLYTEELALGREMERARRECAALALDNGGPAEMIPPYGPNGFNCPWLTPSLSEIFGEGVVAVEASKVIEELPEESKPYAQAILAEADSDSDLMKQCLEKLPPSQVLLRGRLQALLARESKAAEELQLAMESDPPVIRRLGMSLPVNVECADSALKSTLEGSPRFRKGRGFILTVEGGTERGYRGRLLGPDGSVLSSFASEPGKTAAESRFKLCEEVHQRVFAPRVNLTQVDINGLDGSNLAGGHFRDQLNQIVGKKKE